MLPRPNSIDAEAAILIGGRAKVAVDIVGDDPHWPALSQPVELDRADQVEQVEIGQMLPRRETVGAEIASVATGQLDSR
ncbi:MAG: hypothetical protein IPG62_00520 [Sphingomonadales bacterium]|nr:hypothetical protein [Sphingomonadales bacterium]